NIPGDVNIGVSEHGNIPADCPIAAGWRGGCATSSAHAGRVDPVQTHRACVTCHSAMSLNVDVLAVCIEIKIRQIDIATSAARSRYAVQTGASAAGTVRVGAACPGVTCG